MIKYNVGMLLFPDLTVQDFVGPYDVFIRAGCFNVFTISENTRPVVAEGGLVLQAQYSFDDCPVIDLLFVPGGKGITPILTNTSFLTFLKKRGERAQYVTSVCTGSLLLAAAGLLHSYQATTHWRSIPLLKQFGVDTVDARVVKDRNRITGGGITAGIDFGLQLTAWLGGEQMAKTVQLLLEYCPEPPFQTGSLKTADPDTIRDAQAKTQASFEERQRIINKIVRDLAGDASTQLA